ncbi:N-acetylmannosaminyltransferase [hydrothermal vent metagenome]|uniref:N-acetylmannosaminyltransferase n=1 Tax=hydrothermal vent metagenome TaxID=652676 RepID=A0A3B0SEB1_9ZZZZ
MGEPFYSVDQTGERRQNERHFWFLNGTFDRIDFTQAVTRIAEVGTSQAFRFVVTPNVDHLVRMQKEPGWIRMLYMDAWLTVCDSKILQLIAMLTGDKMDVTPGSDLTEQLFETAIQPDEPVVVIGASAEVVDAVSQRYGLTDVRWFEPPMGLRKNLKAVQQCADFVANNPARFSFICVGSPQQEMVAKACLRRGDCEGVGLCVGASLDFLAGKVRRAPKWMQKARIEWLHRLLSEPKRMWKRYLVDGPKIMFLWWQWQKSRRQMKKLEKLVATGVFAPKDLT